MEWIGRRPWDVHIYVYGMLWYGLGSNVPMLYSIFVDLLDIVGCRTISHRTKSFPRSAPKACSMLSTPPSDFFIPRILPERWFRPTENEDTPSSISAYHPFETLRVRHRLDRLPQRVTVPRASTRAMRLYHVLWLEPERCRGPMSTYDRRPGPERDICPIPTYGH